MPEIKNTFLKGKMNKDLDERLVPNGEYRHALNVEVSTSEGSDIGSVKNVLGNHHIPDNILDGFECVGSVANEKTNKLYWFISSYSVDAIVEYDLDNDVSQYVLVDRYASTSKAVLKFFGNIITGINIIDNLLLWTDNRGEPKKINIDTCKAGTVDITTHTKLSFDAGSFHGITLEKISNSADANYYGFKNTGRYGWFESNQLRKLFLEESYAVGQGAAGVPFQFGRSKYCASGSCLPYMIRHYRGDKFLGKKRLKIWAEGASDYGSLFHIGPSYSDSTEKDWKVGDIIFGDNIDIDIEESHVTVIKLKPLNKLSVSINHSEQSSSTSIIPNLFETTFPRFSYRYKFRDGEYSAFAPFTQPVFNAKYPKDTSKSIDASVSYTKDSIYDIKEPYNKAMANSIHSVDLSDFITALTPEDVEEIEILYKKEDSTVIYSIATIKHLDKSWHYNSNHEGLKFDLGKAKSVNGNYQAEGGYTKGRYSVTTENIYAALPANQLLRPYDNVPRKALAQEVSGNRIIYGNYLQNYEVPYSPEVSLGYSDRKNPSSSFEFKGLPSVKSQRNYQLGVVLCDKYGRETPVFTSQKAATNISWQDSKGNNNASKSNQLIASVNYEFPLWVDSLKFFVKQTSNEYYNLIMDRAWVTKNTYELDNSEGHLWLSFPSSDRNKISEEDYIILKKKIEPNASQISFENKFKVIDISNEAPDSIKYRLVNYGAAANNGSQTGDASDLFDTVNSPDFFDNTTQKGTNRLQIDWSKWQDTLLNVPLKKGTGGNAANDDPIDVDGLYVSWSRVGSTDNAASSKYKVLGGHISANDYILNLAKHISKVDADIAHVYGNAGQTAATGSYNSSLDPSNGLHVDLVFQIERKELIDSEDFSGKFFIKISKNQVTDIIETGAEISNLDKYQAKAKVGAHYFRDNIANGNSGYVYDEASGTGYGLTNYNGDSFSPTGNNDWHGGANTGTGGTSWDNTAGGGGILRVADHSSFWKTILADLSDKFENRFFIDAAFMVSGQSDASDYAKYGCVTWSGATAGGSNSAENSSWSYPPIKTWITEFESENGELEENDAWAELLSENQNASGILPGGLVGNFLLMQHASLKVDGWIGPPQSVNRNVPSTTSSLRNNHINGLEGIVTTVDDHTTGPRRWFSGMNGKDNGVGEDTKTYANDAEEGRHFMHLSFLGPGKNLHNQSWSTGGGTLGVDEERIYGPKSFAANLQGIWGGGVFTGEKITDTFGTGTNKWKHMPMEGNHNDTYQYQEEAPGPGVGQGYDMRYRESHERQWDPTFLHDKNDNFIGDPQNKNRDFIRNLYPGAKFRFNRTDTPASSLIPKIGEDVYTIKKVVIKKLYNHTSWRKPLNHYRDGEGYYHATKPHLSHRSVEEVALDFLAATADDGTVSDSTQLKNKIVQFGKSHNRRLCFIIELDKNPSSTDFNPLSHTNATQGEDYINGDIRADNFTDIEFLEPIQDIVLSDLSKFPAIWELSPKKQQVDLDIYYEASDSIPIKINKQTNEIFAPLGCKIEMLNPTYAVDTDGVYLESWDDNTATFYPGFPAHDGSNEIDYENVSFKFTKEDGSYTIAEAGGQQLIGSSASSGTLKTDFVFKQNIGAKIQTGLSWHNCFSFGNGLESNRIKDDFNEVFIANGVKASTTIQERYKEERRKSGLIYSGIYNSNSGVNDLNQFIMAEKITKDLNPTYGSIQKLFQRRISLIAFCEDRVIQITSNKDALFNADGNSQLISTNKVLGDANPFVGEFGISKNPESFASESYRAYFADKQRGAIIRLSKDGLTPISSSGMHDYFKDNLQLHTSLLGTYDSHKENYNITLGDKYSENLIFNSTLFLGSAGDSQENIINSLVANGWIYSAASGSGTYTISTNNINVASTGGFANSPSTIESTVTVTNHEAIPFEYFQTADPGFTPPTEVFALESTFNTFNSPIYILGSAAYSQLPDNGWWYDPGGVSGFSSVSGNLFGYDISSASGHYADAQVYSTIRRVIGNQMIAEGSNITYENSNEFTGNASVSHDPNYLGSSSSSNISSYVSQSITRGISTNFGSGSAAENSPGSIFFDRVASPENSYVAFTKIGLDSGTGLPTGGGVHENYRANGAYGGTGNGPYSGTTEELHGSFFNGEELHVQFDVLAFPTYDGNYSSGNANPAERRKGYNIIIPKIQLFDDGVLVDDSVLVTSEESANSGTSNIVNGIANPQYIYSHKMSLQPFGSLYNTNSAGDENTYVHSNGNFVVGQVNNYRNIKKLASGATVLFPATSGTYGNSPFDTGTVVSNNHPLMNGNPLYHFWPTGNANKPVRLRLGVCFKFRDPDQQNSDGTNILDPTGATGGTMQKQVVNKLEIRIGNDKPKSTNASYNHYQNSAGNTEILASQLWALETLLCKKGVNILTAGEEFDTLQYLDPTSNTQLSLAQLQALYGPNGTGELELIYDPATGQQQYAINGVLAQSPPISSRPSVPDATVPAWVEVNQGGLNDWHLSTAANVIGANSANALSNTNLTSSTEEWFGPNNSATTVNASGIVQPLNGATGSYSSPGSANWIEPTWFNGGGSQPAGALSYPFDPSSDIQLPGGGVGSNNSFTTPTAGVPDTYTIENEYLEIDQSTGNNTSFMLNHHITGTPFELNEWYLVDIEYQTDNYDVFSEASGAPVIGSYYQGGTNDDGLVSVVGVVDQAISVSNFNTTTSIPIDVNGIGVLSGGSNNRQITCIPVWRDDYSNSRWVLRAVFQVHPNSNVNSGAFLDHLTLRFYNFKNEALKIQKIITRNVSAFQNTGIAEGWTKPAIYDKYHTFSDGFQIAGITGKSNMYYSVNKLSWDNVPKLDADGVNASNYMSNLSATPSNLNLWTLKFTVSDNEFLAPGNFSGELGLRVTTSDYDGNGNAAGIIVEDIVAVGDYIVQFDLDGATAPVMIQGTATASAYTPSSTFNVVRFYNASSSNTLTAAVSQIELTDLQEVFSGAEIGSWNYGGFEPTIDQYIVYDVTDQRIQFENAPLFDSSFVGVNPVMVNQLIEAPLNRYETYEVSFSYSIENSSGGIGDGELCMYYFNSSGYGFVIKNIGPNPEYSNNGVFTNITDGLSSTTNANNNTEYLITQKVTITALSTIEVDDINVNPLINTLVIRKQNENDPNSEVTAWIDNISIQLFPLPNEENVTISFSEKTNGWTSFKSFIPESGVSLSKKYFTFNQAKLYEHYVPTIDNIRDASFTPENSNNYNNFYGQKYNSTIKAVLNAEPSIIKTFNTLSYEGSQAYVTKPTNTIINNVLHGAITINNAKAVLADIDGWSAIEVKTDLDEGSLNEFIKKEGKWFGPIKGIEDTGTTANLRTSNFSVQGLGKPTVITLEQ